MSVNMRDIVRRIIAKLGLNFTEGSARHKRSPFAQRTVKNGQLVHTLTGHKGAVYSVAFSPDGRYIASGSVDNTVKVRETESGELVQTLVGHGGEVSSVAFSPDGRHIVSGSKDETLKLWETESGNLVRVFTGHENWVSSVAFSPNGKYIRALAKFQFCKSFR